jgi:Protein of unknown function (DUF3443)
MAKGQPRMGAALLRILRWSACVAVCASAISCGGGSGGNDIGPSPPPPPANSNVADVIVDSGPSNGSVNTLFTSVTLCVPGSTTECQTIDHIQIDTASFGLRILAPALTLTLPVQTALDGNSLLECTQFADGYSWGPVALADVQIAGESAPSAAIQVIGDPHFTNVPANCSGSGAEEDTVAAFGANGILGIGVFAQDCGTQCESSASPQFYYSCTASTCQATVVPLASQVSNPVGLFATDNNGSILELPSVPSQGALTASGSLIFGVDTQANNASGNETVLTVDPSFGYLTVVFSGQSLGQSFIDAGSNGNYFDANIAPCSDTGLSGFYCPASTQNFTVTMQGTNAMSAAVNFSVTSAQVMFDNNPSFTALPELAGSNPLPGSFDFGLPFFYGRRVLTVLEGQVTAVDTGPYIAF